MAPMQKESLMMKCFAPMERYEKPSLNMMSVQSVQKSSFRAELSDEDEEDEEEEKCEMAECYGGYDSGEFAEHEMAYNSEQIMAPMAMECMEEYEQAAPMKMQAFAAPI